MKKLFSIIFILLLPTAFSVFLSSCSDTDTTTPDTDSREKFLGTWTVNESCVRLNYEVEITADSNNDRLYIQRAKYYLSAGKTDSAFRDIFIAVDLFLCWDRSF
jgi:hypothetical protein